MFFSARGVLRRVHGGAISLERFAHEYTIPERYGQNPNQKRLVADVALPLSPMRDASLLTVALTTECLAVLSSKQARSVGSNQQPDLGRKDRRFDYADLFARGKIRPANLSAVGAKTCEDHAGTNCFG